MRAHGRQIVFPNSVFIFSYAAILLGHFDLENKDTTILQNIGTHPMTWHHITED
jgi:hypothetical protein